MVGGHPARKHRARLRRVRGLAVPVPVDLVDLALRAATVDLLDARRERPVRPVGVDADGIGRIDRPDGVQRDAQEEVVVAGLLEVPAQQRDRPRGVRLVALLAAARGLGLALQHAALEQPGERVVAVLRRDRRAARLRPRRLRRGAPSRGRATPAGRDDRSRWCERPACLDASAQFRARQPGTVRRCRRRSCRARRNKSYAPARETRRGPVGPLRVMPTPEPPRRGNSRSPRCTSQSRAFRACSCCASWTTAGRLSSPARVIIGGAWGSPAPQR